MGKTDFGVKFPTHGKSSKQGKKNPTPGAPKNAMPTSGKPKGKKDFGGKFPTTEK